jgi:hypothetical protein
MISRGIRLLVLAALGLYLLSAAPDCAFACSCVPPGTPQEELERASVVFSGKVLSMKAKQQGQAMSSADPVAVFFETAHFWKGQPSETVLLETAASGASCGFEFRPGLEYIVYAYRDDQGTLQASLCSRTNLLEQAGEDLAALGEGDAPASVQETSPPSTMPDSSVTTTSSSNDRLLAIGGALVASLAVVLGILVGARLRRARR